MLSALTACSVLDDWHFLKGKFELWTERVSSQLRGSDVADRVSSVGGSGDVNAAKEQLTWGCCQERNRERR